MVSHEIRRLEPSLRLTRRGRAVVLVVLFLAATLASVVLFTTASRADESSGPAPTVVVQQGDTLWGIAARTMHRRDNQVAVAELRDLNKLPSYDIQPGDVLVLPRGH
jgi:LysM repeat protein